MIWNNRANIKVWEWQRRKTLFGWEKLRNFPSHWCFLNITLLSPTNHFFTMGRKQNLYLLDYFNEWVRVDNSPPATHTAKWQDRTCVLGEMVKWLPSPTPPTSSLPRWTPRFPSLSHHACFHTGHTPRKENRQALLTEEGWAETFPALLWFGRMTREAQVCRTVTSSSSGAGGVSRRQESPLQDMWRQSVRGHRDPES